MEQFVLSCQAHGLSTLVMEGFDGRYVAKAINAPKRYFVTSLVPFGYSDEVGVKPTGRYEPEKLVYNEKFGEGRTTITKFERRLGVCCHNHCLVVHVAAYSAPQEVARVESG